MPTDLEAALILAIVLNLAALAVLGWAFAIWRAGRRRQAHLAGLEAALATVPGAYLVWNAGGRVSASGALEGIVGQATPDFETVAGLLYEDDAAELRRRVGVLRQRGEAFTVTVAAREADRTFQFDGRRPRRGRSDYLWLRDVSDEVRARDETAARLLALTDERDGFDALLDALPAPVWRRGPDLALSHVNRAYAEALDRDAAAVVAAGRELSSGGIAQGGRALAALARRTGMRQTESHHVVVGGTRRLFEFNELPAGDGVVGFARDVTELEEAQAELDRHIDAHGDVLENVATAIAIYGPDTRLKFYNAAFAKLWDLEPRWLDGEPTLDEELEALREKRRLPEMVDFRAFKAEQGKLFTSVIEPLEELVHLPDGRTLRKRISPHPFGGLLITYEDVTDSLALEGRYNTAIQVQRRTLDNLYEGVAVIGGDGRLKLSNPAYARLWQFSEEDLEDEPHISDLIEMSRDFFPADDDWPAMKQRIIARMTERGARTGRLERSDNSVLEYAIVPLPDGAVLLSYIDVTDGYRVEQALRERTEALEAADQLKTEFIANVSYELRTPLNSIIGFAEVLHGEMFGPLEDRQREYMAGILNSSQSLLQLINEILDLATIEAGYMVLEPSTFDIHAMIVGVYNLTHDRARQQRLEVEYTCQPDIGTMIGDERRLKQAMIHLVGNATKFTPDEGVITIGAARDGDDVVFTVRDTGVGIPSDELPRMMEEFERGVPPPVRRTGGAGAGLGLSLVKSYVELHGGTVALESEPAVGTCVTLRLPSGPPVAAVPAKDAAVDVA